MKEHNIARTVCNMIILYTMYLITWRFISIDLCNDNESVWLKLLLFLPFAIATLSITTIIIKNKN